MTPEQLKQAAAVMDSREQFENMQNRLGVSTRKNAAGVYTNKGTRAAWFGWQASREALVVKLPAPDDLYEDFKILFDGESGVASTKATLLCGKLQLLLIQALDQAGVRYE